MSAFPLGRVAWAAALGGIEKPHGQQQYQMVLPATQHQDIRSKVRDVVTPLDPY